MVRAQVGLSVIVDGASMPFQFLVVKALSVPVILGMEFQKEHVKAIYPGCETVAWNHGGLTRAENAWDGKKKEPKQAKGIPARRDKDAIYLRQGVIVAPRTVQAVSVVRGTAVRVDSWNDPRCWRRRDSAYKLPLRYSSPSGNSSCT